MKVDAHTTMRDAQALLRSVEALDITPPSQLKNLCTGYALIARPAPAPDPTDAILDTAIDGKLDEKKLAQLCTTATTTVAAADYRAHLARAAGRKFLHRFAALLENGDADAILDAMRPDFNDAATRLATALQAVDPTSITDAELAGAATPEQLTAWRELPAILDRLDRVANVATAFGVLGRFPLILDPRSEIVALRGTASFPLRDKAILCTDGSLDHASRAFAQAHRVGDIRTSPWLRVTPRLHTIAEANERIRVWAEAAWDADNAARGKRTSTVNGEVVEDKRHNPYRIAETV